MATTITTSYAGEFAGKYIGAALLASTTLDNNLITIKTNIKYKETVKRGILVGVVKDASCDFTNTGDLTLDDRVIEPKRLDVNFENCKQDFFNDWEAMQMGFGLSESLPPSYVDWLIAQLSASVAVATEKSIWQGVKANSGEFDGFLTLMAADSSITPITGSAITPANVQVELQKVYDAIPDELFGNPDLAIYVPQNVVKAYLAYLGTTATSYLTQVTVGEKPLDYLGIPLLLANGMKASNMIAGLKENFWFGTGLMASFNEVKVIDMADIDGSQNVRFVMRYNAGVQYGFSAEIVWYKV